MIHADKVDLGSIQIHKKVIADIAANALKDIDGVSLAPKNLGHRVSEFLGIKNASVINVILDKNGQVSLEVLVYIRYGMNIPDLARQIQDIIRIAVDKTTEIILKEIDVNVQGIERGKT